jgi:flagellar M-ring protein FliF
MAGEIATDNDLNFDPKPSGGGQNFVQDIIGDPQKRLYAIIGAVVFVVLIISIIFFAGKGNNENEGKLVPLVQEIDQARAFEVVAKLKSVNIEAKINPSEKPGQYVVQVYDKAIESAYLTLSRTNLLEDDGYGLFDQNDWAASDYDKRIKLTRAINGDLSRIISRMEGLRSATVRVNIPEQQLFSELQAETTVTVQVELENDGDELSKSQVKSIVNLLRGYVPNLDKDKVSIVDTQGRNYNMFKEENDADTEEYIEELEKINSVIEKRIAKYLDAVIGSSDYKVSVSASVSREKVEQLQTIYSEGAVGSRQTGSEKLNSSSGSESAGPAASNSGKNYDSQSSIETMLPSY